MGTKASGIVGHVRGWDIGARVNVDEYDGQDVVTVVLTGGINGGEGEICLGQYVIDEAGEIERR